MALRPALRKRVASAALFVALVLSTSLIPATAAGAAPLANITLLMAQSTAGATDNDLAFSFNNQSTTPISCIVVGFNTMPDESGFTPPGFDASSASFSGSFMSSWNTWTSTNSTGMARVTRSGASSPSGGFAQIMLSHISNGSNSNVTYFAFLNTYTDNACTHPVDSGELAFTYTDATTVSADVDPSLSYFVDGLNAGSCNGEPVTGTGSTGTGISLGRVDKNSRAVGAQIIDVNANAGNGFSVTAHTNGPLADGQGHTITTLSASPDDPQPFATPGNEAFGYTTDSWLSGGTRDRFVNSGPKWAGIDTGDREIMYSTSVGVEVKNCIAFQITISKQTFGGYYGAGVTYNIIPNF